MSRNRQYARSRAARLLVSLTMVLMLFGAGGIVSAQTDEVIESDAETAEHDHSAHDHSQTADATDDLDAVPECDAASTEPCTHGPDFFPPSFHTELSSQAVQSTNIACIGDGTSGRRVQLIYAYRAGTTNNYDTHITEIRQIAAGMESIFNDSAALTGGTRHIRFVHDNSPNCTVDVQTATLTLSAINDFGATITQLTNEGFDDPNGRYLVFVDTTNTLCGIGEYYNDDSAGSNNAHNGNILFSRVDRQQPGGADCWTAAVASHELMHNLGGVQNSAPNSSYQNPIGNQGGHCIDEYDIMCYEDYNGTLPVMQIECANQALDNTLLDCNHDDYYNTNPAPASYLATKWNAARSLYLDATATTNTPPTVVAPTFALPLATVSAIGSVRVTISWSATDTDGIGSYQLQQSRNGGDWVNIGLPSPTSKSIIRNLIAGSTFEFRVMATDSLGAASDWVSGTSFRVKGFQESNPTYTGAWTPPTNLTDAWGGKVRYATTSNAVASLAFTGRSIAFVSTVGPNRGKAEIYLDGVKVKTVDITVRRGPIARSSSHVRTFPTWHIRSKSACWDRNTSCPAALASISTRSSRCNRSSE